MKNKAFIFLNGSMDTTKNFYKEILKNEKNIFCADGGVKFALELNLKPLEIWGDLDSCNKNLIDKARSLNCIINKFNPEKDLTDGELLISDISNRDYDEIIILGGLGGRTDHFLTNLNLLFKYSNIIFLSDTEKIFRVTPNFNIINEINKTVSFIPMTDTVHNLTLSGFKYPLNNFLLSRGDSICNSNVITKSNAHITFSNGKLIGIIENL